jgi:hypothetical protein
VVIDRRWDVVLANAAAGALVADLPMELLTPTLNVYRFSLHPDGLWGRSTNPEEWGAYLVWQLERSLSLTADAGLQALHDEVLAYPNVAAMRRRGRTSLEEAPIVVPFRFPAPGGGELSLFTTLTTFGTPRDITLDELAVELFYPADDESDALLRAGAAAARS